MTELWMVASSARTQSGTQYLSIGNSSQNLRCVEVDSQTEFELAGTLSCLGIFVLLNFFTGSDTHKLRIAGSNGNICVTVTGTTTGLFEDTVNSDSISATDDLGIQSIIDASLNQIRFNRFKWEPDSGLHTMQAAACMTHGINCATNFWPFHGVFSPVSVEGGTEVEYADAATLSGHTGYVNSNTRSTNTSLRPRINSTNGNQIITWGNVETGRKTDTCNTDSISAGDNASFGIITLGGGGNIVITGNAINSIDTTSLNAIAIHGSGGNEFVPNIDAPAYVHGSMSTMQSGESECEFQLPAILAYTWSDIWGQMNCNSLTTATSTVVSRIEGSDGNQVASWAAGVTGEAKDTTNSDSLSVDDNINSNLHITDGGAGETFLTSICSLLSLPSGRTHWSTYINSSGMI